MRLVLMGCSKGLRLVVWRRGSKGRRVCGCGGVEAVGEVGAWV